MVLPGARRLLTAAMFVHLLASPNASMGLRLAPFCLLRLNAAEHGTCALLSPRTSLSCMCTPLTWLVTLSSVAGAATQPVKPVQVGPTEHSSLFHSL